MKTQNNKNNTGSYMTEDEIGELLDAISEDFTTEEIFNDEFITEQLRYFLGFNDAEIRVFLPALRDYKKLRGDILPLWAQGLQKN